MPGSRVRWWGVAGVAGILLATPAGVAAYTFVLTGDGSSQTVTWLTEGCAFSNNRTTFAVDGRIPLFASTPGPTYGGGMLDWVSSSGSLKVVALSVARAVGSTPSSCAGGWGAVDARAVPLVFEVVPEPGDPFPLLATLQIHPRLLGTAEVLTNVGATATLWLQLMMRVAVDGEMVSADSVWGAFPYSDGNDLYWPLSFPKGGANSTMVSDVAAGSEITIWIWAYMRGYVSGVGTVDAFSAYGDGPAIEIWVRDENAVGVPEEAVPAGLSLAARPNPFHGSTRIEYALLRTGPVRLSIYDVTGQRVTTLVDRTEVAGRREVAWDGVGARGERVRPGIYVVELESGPRRTIAKLVLLGR